MLHWRAPTYVLLRAQVARQAAPCPAPPAARACEFPICAGSSGFPELISPHLNVERWMLSCLLAKAFGVGRFPPLYLTNQSAPCAQIKPSAIHVQVNTKACHVERSRDISDFSAFDFGLARNDNS